MESSCTTLRQANLFMAEMYRCNDRGYIENRIEKIAYLPHKLTEDASGPFGNEAPGDLCYFSPWGNLDVLRRLQLFRWADPARPLRRFRGVALRGTFPSTIERII
jgi:hypothetical protein